MFGGFSVGYRALANFNRQFMKLKGMTPTQFREHTRSRLSKLPVLPSILTSLESLNP